MKRLFTNDKHEECIQDGRQLLLEAQEVLRPLFVKYVNEEGFKMRDVAHIILHAVVLNESIRLLAHKFDSGEKENEDNISGL